ncbi:MAG: protein-disulfide reductase DsbD family protein [Planctomycetota bacterium]|nr:protein-disulfide reductase DsbD family protein [Planctomycetota bacterium]
MIGFQTMLTVYGACAAAGIALMIPQDAPTSATTPVVASIIPYIASASDDTQYVVIRFKLEPQWHIYWSNAGDSGATPTVHLSMPTGWTIGQAEFPRPQILGNTQERNYGYENSMDLMIPVVAPAGDVPASISVSAKVDWFVCKTSCQMGRATLTTQLTTEPKKPLVPLNPRVYPSKLPPSIRATLEGTPTSATLVVTGPTKSFVAQPVRFIPDPTAGVQFSDGTGPFLAVQSGNTVTARIPFTIHLEDAVDGPPRIRGLLLTGERETDPAYRIDMALPDVPVSAK